MKKVVIAPRERIDAYERTAVEFFRAVLGMEDGECIVTDESRLSDFASCGLPEDIADATQSLEALYSAWDAWIVPVICSRYGVADISTSILLVDLFELIERQGAKQIHRRAASDSVPRGLVCARPTQKGWYEHLEQGREPRMARRGKTSPAEDLMDIVAMLPWWVGVMLALLSYLLLHSVASQQVVATAQPGQVAAMVTQTLWKTLASVSQYILPILCLGVVRELYGVMAARGATGGFVVTAGRFTDEAISFASDRNVNLVDGPKLHGLIRQARAAIDPPPARPATTPAVPPSAAPMQASSCPLCS